MTTRIKEGSEGPAKLAFQAGLVKHPGVGYHPQKASDCGEFRARRDLGLSGLDIAFGHAEGTGPIASLSPNHDHLLMDLGEALRSGPTP